MSNCLSLLRQVSLKKGAVHLWINHQAGEEQNTEVELGIRLNDNQWHKVEIRRSGADTRLVLDDSQATKVGHHTSRLK